MSALIVAAQAGDALDVDILTGASSGALTSVIAAAALLTGRDPIEPLRRAWVTEPSLDSLRDAQVRAPLSLQRARSVGHSVLAGMLLDGGGGEGGRKPRMSKVTVECALTCLRGCTYPLPGDGDVTATSYLDWARFEFWASDRGGLTKKWSTALDSAIASASLPLAFAPALLKRPAGHEAEISNLHTGDNGNRLWYADGGLVNREPLRRCIHLARESRRKGGRRVLAVRPGAKDAPGPKDPAWTGADEAPRYRESLERALRILVTHNVYEDLCAVEATNARIALTRELAKRLAGLISDPAGAGQTLGAGEISTQAELVDVLEQQLQAAAGLGGKTTVDVDVVAPEHASDLGRGAVGLTAERIRSTDFLLGYQAMYKWISAQRDKATGVELEGLKKATDVVRGRAATIPGWLPDVPTGRRPLRVSAKLARLGARTIRAGLTNPRAGDPN